MMSLIFSADFKSGGILIRKSDLNINQITNYIMLVILSLVFFMSAVTKIMDPNAFVIDISNYRLFPIFILNSSAIFMIMLELTVSISLWVPLYQKASALIISGLMAFFILIVGIAVLRGLDISCGCFGADSQKVGLTKIVENLFLLGISLKIVINNGLKRKEPV